MRDSTTGTYFFNDKTVVGSNDLSYSKEVTLICLKKLLSELPKSDVNKNFACLV